jgi:hypothetical protein
MDEEPVLYSDGIQVASHRSRSPSASPSRLRLSRHPPPIPVATIRMSLEHAKVMAIILRKQIKLIRAAARPGIALPQPVYQRNSAGPREDW